MNNKNIAEKIGKSRVEGNRKKGIPKKKKINRGYQEDIGGHLQ